jgi:hypothetical protein
MYLSNITVKLTLFVDFSKLHAKLNLKHYEIRASVDMTLRLLGVTNTKRCLALTITGNEFSW